MPPPRDAGKLFHCPHCRSPFRFTGAGALPPPPAPVQVGAVAVATVNVPDRIEARQVFDLAAGIRLFFQSFAAVVAEVFVYFLFAMASPPVMVGLLARCFAFLFVATLAVGFAAPFVGMANAFRSKR